jgi:uncharacterized tellurite resistance protein B-like protein
MIKKLINQISDVITSPATTTDDAATRDVAIRNATAVLMVDVARADYSFDEDEFDSLLRLIQAHFDLSAEQAAAVVNAADEKVDGLTSLHDFTQLLHNNLDEREKAHVVGLLWRIAYADGRLDKYEDALVLKISDLLHVSRGKVMQLKHDAGNNSAD